MRINIRAVLSFIYILIFLAMVASFPGCSKGEVEVGTAAPVVVTPVSFPVVEGKPTSVVRVQCYERRDGRIPGMDIVVRVVDEKVGVDSITVQFEDSVRDGLYSDLCGNWHREEDNEGVTWAVSPKGTSCTVDAPVPTALLTKGTWVLTVNFQGERVPLVSGVSCTERQVK